MHNWSRCRPGSTRRRRSPSPSRHTDPHARYTLRRVLITDQADRDAIASQLLRYPDDRGDDWADIIDMLTMHPEAGRQVVRVLGELDAFH